MADEVEPFGRETAKAVQEVAKTTDSAIEAGRELASFLNRVLGNPIADAVGLTLSDPIRAARIIALDWYNRRVKEILAKRDLKKLQGATPRIALEILEAAQDETRDELRELWAQLIANAMDVDAHKYVRIEFVEVLRQLNPLDALVLQRLSSVGNFISPHHFAQAQHLDSNDTATSFLYLHDLKCLQQAADGSYSYKLSPRGIALLKAVGST